MYKQDINIIHDAILELDHRALSPSAPHYREELQKIIDKPQQLCNDETMEEIITVTAIHIKGWEWDKRTFGWFSKMHEASRAVKYNACDMHECYYEYIVVEKFTSGIHCSAIEDYWYKWETEQDRWVPTAKPEHFDGTYNFGLG